MTTRGSPVIAVAETASGARSPVVEISTYMEQPTASPLGEQCRFSIPDGPDSFPSVPLTLASAQASAPTNDAVRVRRASPPIPIDEQTDEKPDELPPTMRSLYRFDKNGAGIPANDRAVCC